jgi:hypothetical protein
VKRVHLLGLGEAGLWVILARGLAGGAVVRTWAEAPEFDFADVKSVDDPRFLPGGVKYGGWGAFAALAAPGELILAGKGEAPEVLRAAYRAAGAGGRLARHEKTPSPAELARELLR